MAGISRQIRDQVLVESLARGLSVQDAATAAGMSPRTAFRRLEDESVRQKVADDRARLMDSVTGRLTASAIDAAKVLAELLLPTPGLDNKTRLMAAKAVINLQLSLTNLLTLERRLAALEKANAANGE